MRLGIDVGSTTVKLVLIDENDKIIYQRYERHMSSVFSKVSELLRQLMTEKGDIKVKAVITGSGGLALAETIKSRFEQEVITCSLAVAFTTFFTTRVLKMQRSHSSAAPLSKG